ncbi:MULTISPECIES: LysR family transcriptional regulator [unclassified Agarivorans]|uniref:LysR family transcriptional regulator n=1 Tax=unclassified Agarivorans TaxID=2636026 RepID=UPI003D7C96DD
MRLRQIEIFQAIVQAGTISGAARLLNVSQPNVSRILNHTEQQLGFSLFERHAQGMRMTEEGQMLLPEIEQVYDKLQSISELALSLRKNKVQTVKIGAAHAFGQMVVAPSMVAFCKQDHAVQVNLVTEHFAALSQLVLSKELDFALVFGQHVAPKLFAEPLFQSVMVAVLPEEMPSPPVVSLSWLCEHDLIMMQRDDPLGRVLHRALDDKKLTPRSALHVKTYSVIADMVLSGGGVGIVDVFTARCYEQKLKIVPIAQALPFEVMFLSRVGSPQSPATLKLKQQLKMQCQLVAQQALASVLELAS